MAERMAGRPESELAWAERRLRSWSRPSRLAGGTTLRVVERAQSFGDVLDRDELNVLLAASYLHDVGYAPDLAEVGSIRSTGPASCARRDTSGSLGSLRTTPRPMRRPRNAASRTSWISSRRRTPSRPSADVLRPDDGPNWREVGVSARLVELGARLGDDDPTVPAVRREATRLAAVVDEMESLLAAAR